MSNMGQRLTTAGLQHPRVLPLLDSGAADGLRYYVMPHVRGEMLRARLEREGQLPVDESLRIVAEVTASSPPRCGGAGAMREACTAV